MAHVSADPKTPVYIRACKDYEKETMRGIVKTALEELGVTAELLRGKKVAVKPNLIMKKAPDSAATTHPALLDAVLAFLDTCGCADVVIAESPGGAYTEAALRSNYRVSGIEGACEGHQVRLNTDVTNVQVPNPEGKLCKLFDIITPIDEADVIFNLCKLKCHSLTRLSGAVKNTFGTIPGLTKFEYHARFHTPADFNEMLVDLSYWAHTKTALTVDLMDAVVGMEGNGPTGGKPRAIGAVLASRNPFNLDRIAEALIGCPGEVPMIRDACERGFCPETAEEVPTFGDEWKPLIVTDFKAPDTERNFTNKLFFDSKFPKLFEPRPVVRTKTCIGCGECVRSCPVHTIALETDKNGKKHAKINPDNCIRCFCCQELCPIHSVDIHKNPILRTLAAFRR